MPTNTERIKALEAWRKAHTAEHATGVIHKHDPTPPPPPPPPPPPTGIPPIPAGRGTLFRKDFADGSLAPFRVLTYPNDHIGGSGQHMTVYNRFRSTPPAIHDGYIDFRAVKRPDNLWDAELVGTSQDGSGPTFGYGRFSFLCRANVGHGTWQSAWLYDTTHWSATEIDWPEMLEGRNLSAHILGQGAGGWYGDPPADWATTWHEFTIERRATYVAFLIDGVEVYRKTAAMPSTPLAILLDAKVGFPWAEGPDATTPNPTWFQVAWVTVDP